MPPSRFLSVTAEGLAQPLEGVPAVERARSGGSIMGMYFRSTEPHSLWDHSTWKGKKPPTPLCYHYPDSTDDLQQ